MKTLRLPAVVRDSRVRDFVWPCRVVWMTDAPHAPEDPAPLLEQHPGQAIVHTSRRPCVLRSGAGLVLDYGREICGGVRFVTADNHPRTCRVRVRFGESVSEAMGAPNNDHAMHDVVVDLPWHGTAEIGNTGFRFVRVDVLGKNAIVELRGVPAVSVYRDLPWKGTFRCSDDRLNRIWQTGAYTVQLNMQDYVWDGIKRDRLVWLGDMHPEVRVICSVFDDDGVVPASLDLDRDNTPLPGHINGISSYSLWWIIIQRDWFLYKGDRDYLEAQRGYLLPLLRQFMGCVDAAGSETLPPARFLDWPTSEDEAAKHAGLQGLLSWALAAGEELCRVLGEHECAADCRNVRGRMRSHVPEAGRNKQANALLVLGGLADAARTNAAALSVRPLSGLSTFYGYYVLEARARAGDFVGALNVIRSYWGAMLDFGATTFWEDFDLEWTRNASRVDELPVPGKDDLHADFGNYCYRGLRHSLCHGWAGGPTAWLSAHILGVQPAAPGCSRVTIKPNLGDLEWAEGALPTPHGPIRVRHEKDGRGGTRTEFELPPGVNRVADAPPGHTR